MAFLQLQDKTGMIEGTVFSENYKKLHELLQEGTVVALQCSLSYRDEKPSLLIDNVKLL